MVGEEPRVFGLKLSSTVPENVTPEGTIYNFTNTDLAMKLHYIKAVYFFTTHDVDGLDLNHFKEPTFPLLDIYFMTSGRIRRQESVRQPYIKCNDSGLRFVEAQCASTLADYLALIRAGDDVMNELIYHSALGPNLLFSPLVYLQVTFFKCGGVSLGLSWAHVLGDAVAAASYMNLYARFLSGDRSRPRLSEPDPRNQTGPNPTRIVKPIGDHWVLPIPNSNPNLRFYSFFVVSEKLKTDIRQFEALSAIIWRCLGRIRGYSARIVTICREESSRGVIANPRNLQRVRMIEVDFDVGQADVLDLARLIAESNVDDVCCLDGDGDADLILYGAKLTFVSLEDVDVYGMEIRGKKPVLANFCVEGVGDAGAVVMVPWVGEDGHGGGWIVNVTLPENEVKELKIELSREWSL